MSGFYLRIHLLKDQASERPYFHRWAKKDLQNQLPLAAAEHRGPQHASLQLWHKRKALIREATKQRPRLELFRSHQHRWTSRHATGWETVQRPKSAWFASYFVRKLQMERLSFTIKYETSAFIFSVLYLYCKANADRLPPVFSTHSQCN